MLVRCVLRAGQPLFDSARTQFAGEFEARYIRVLLSAHDVMQRAPASLFYSRVGFLLGLCSRLRTRWSSSALAGCEAASARAAVASAIAARTSSAAARIVLAVHHKRARGGELAMRGRHAGRRRVVREREHEVARASMKL